MPHVSATERPIFWAVGEPVIEAGITPVGATTVTGLSMVSDESETAFLAATQGSASGYEPLPAPGEWLVAGTIYANGANLVIVRQSHARTAHDPADVPALFLTYREDAGDVLTWVVGEQVYVGTHRMHDGVEYTCLQAHVTQSDQEPDAPGITGVLWGIVPQTDEWAIGVAYAVDDVVLYEGAEYICLQAHTSIAAWAPSNPDIINVLWALVE